MSGNLWIVSAQALSKATRKHGQVSIENYTKSFFENDLTYSEAQPLVLPDGRLVIGTTKGVLSFAPSDIHKSHFVPRLHLDSPEEVTLQPDTHNFTLAFSTLDYEQNEPIQYAYRMENGTDTAWHYTTEAGINFQSLAPGTYRLHLRSTNGDGVWVDNERVVTIRQLAHFYQSTWFWIVAALLLSVLFYFIWRAIAIFRRQQRELRELKDIRISNKQRIDLLTTQLRDLLPIGEKAEKMAESDNLKSEEDQSFSDKLKAFIESKLADSDLRIDDLAREMCVSRTLLFVRVKDIFNTTPNNLVTNLRINRAQLLLRSDDAKIVDVAFKCGYSDAKYFSRQFKKIAGVSPTEYQLRVQKQRHELAVGV